jgi:hypothetical protein
MLMSVCGGVRANVRAQRACNLRAHALSARYAPCRTVSLFFAYVDCFDLVNFIFSKFFSHRRALMLMSVCGGVRTSVRAQSAQSARACAVQALCAMQGSQSLLCLCGLFRSCQFHFFQGFFTQARAHAYECVWGSARKRARANTAQSARACAVRALCAMQEMWGRGVRASVRAQRARNLRAHALSSSAKRHAEQSVYPLLIMTVSILSISLFPSFFFHTGARSCL